MPHDPSPNAITIENTELYFTDIECVLFIKGKETHSYNFEAPHNKIQLRHFINFIVSERKEDYSIKIIFTPNHKFNKRYPNLKAYETTLKGLKYLIENYPDKYYPPLGKSTDLDNPTTPLID